jgi:hypothetical protein
VKELCDENKDLMKNIKSLNRETFMFPNRIIQCDQHEIILQINTNLEHYQSKIIVHLCKLVISQE